jgi:PIN domain nuclease of toxin-antitoxin system
VFGRDRILQEKGRIPAHLKTTFESKLKFGASGLVVADMTMGVVDAMATILRTDVPEMPDRIIAATALHLGLPLMSRDHKIRSSSVTTIW